MRYALAPLALAALAVAQKAPSSTPAGCSENYSGSFEIQTMNVTSSTKRGLEERQDNGSDDTTLVLTLSNGVLTDSKQRQGYVASNEQFQFNTPLQSNAIYTSGFSVCSNGSLALTSAIWYQCLSGSFNNLYATSIGGQCYPVYITVVPTSGSSSPTPSVVASEQPDGQPTASAVSSPVCEYSDGQPQQGCTTTAVCEYKDGQPQEGCSSAPAPTTAVCEYSDGQPQEGCTSAPAPTTAVCEYSDGQPQEGCTSAPAPTSAVCEYSDGQPQEGCSMTSAVCEYSDGQPQEGCSMTPAPAPAPAPTSAVCEYSDGQPQEGCSTTMATSAVCEFTDGQPQEGCSTVAAASPSVQPYTPGSGAMPTAIRGEIFGLAAGVLAVAML